MRLCAHLFFLYLFCSSVAAGVKEDVRQLAGEKKYNQAITLIKQQQGWRNNGELNFLYVQVLAWSGSLPLANEELDILLKGSSENIDYLLMKSRLLFWGKEYKASLVLLDRILVRVPENEEARGVLLKVVYATMSNRIDFDNKREILLAKYKHWLPDEVVAALSYSSDSSGVVSGIANASPEKVRDKYKLFADLSISSLSNGSPNWVEQLYGAVYTGHEFFTPVVSISRLSRFDIVDSNVSTDMYARYGVHNLYLSLSRSLYERLIPTYSFITAYGLNPIRYFGIAAKYKFDEYSAVRNQTGMLELRANLGRGSVMYKFSSTFVGDVGRGAANGLSLRYSAENGLVAFGGVSYGDELEVDASGKASLYRVTNYQMGFKVRLGRQADANLTFVRHVQGSVYVRSGLTSGISVSF